MLLIIAEWLRQEIEAFSFLRVLTYITVRSALAMMCAFLLTMIIGAPMIRRLRLLRIRQQIRKTVGEKALDLSEMHGAKSETPTMGGLMIVFAVIFTTLLCCRWDQSVVWLSLAMISAFALIGFYDDLLTLRYKNHKGLSARLKLFLEGAVAAALAAYLIVDDMGVVYQIGSEGSAVQYSGYPYLSLPFFKGVYPYLGFLFIPFVVLVLCATSNSVNLTDGLDGLAIGCTIISTMALVVITYLLGRSDYASYLIFPYVPQAGELTVMLSAMLGAGLGFLWFNSHPAEVFMGDTGSLALGGFMGTVAVLMKQELLLILIGGIFVIEALSVMLQVASFRLRGGKRIFRMAPLHHHFERAGLAESKIILRFWIIAILLAMLGLGTLKLR